MMMGSATLRPFAVVLFLFFLLLETPAGVARSVDDEILSVQRGLRAPLIAVGDHHTWTLNDRMIHYHVPGVSIAVVDGGVVRWAQGFGFRDANTHQRMDAETLFQAGSISKLVTAIATLRLVQDGNLVLDRNVNEYLQRWKVPDNQWTRHIPVTLRMLMTHTGGTSVHGFDGYLPRSALPSLEQVLDGAPPANSSPVRVVRPPGAETVYSGGGVLIEQLVLEELSHRSFDDLLKELVFKPLEMKHSSWSQPLGAPLSDNAAVGHTSKGTVIEGGARLYPELAAAGLWSTPSDLARLGISIQTSLAGDSSGLLNASVAASMMRTAKGGSYGLGPAIRDSGTPAARFLHGGSNAGFQSFFEMYERGGHGVIVMTNGEEGTPLANEIVAAVRDVYGWPAPEAEPRVVVRLTRGMMARLVGDYVLQDGDTLAIRRSGASLSLSAGTDSPAEATELKAQSSTRLFGSDLGIVLNFEQFIHGRARIMRLQLPEEVMLAKRAAPLLK
jgi:CubicO group peptidase (beta-lactamase class C family)